MRSFVNIIIYVDLSIVDRGKVLKLLRSYSEVISRNYIWMPSTLYFVACLYFLNILQFHVVKTMTVGKAG